MRNPALMFLSLLSPLCLGQEILCERLEPISTPEPAYPTAEQAKRYFDGTSYLHVFVAGSVTIEYVVSTSGRVTQAEIIESSYRVVGPNSERYPEDHVKGFLEINVVPTIQAWTYREIDQPCRAQYVVKYQVEDDA